MNIEDVKYHCLKSICGYEAMIGSQQTTFIVAPCLDLCRKQLRLPSMNRSALVDQQCQQAAYQDYAPLEDMLSLDMPID